MRWILIIIILFLPTVTLSQEITLTLEGDSNEITCPGLNQICNVEGKEYLIYQDSLSHTYRVIGGDVATGDITMRDISQIKQDGETIFLRQEKQGCYGGIESFSNPLESYNLDYIKIMEMLSFVEYGTLDLSWSSSNTPIEEFRSRLLAALEHKIDKLNQLFTEDQIEIILNDGTRINCQRAAEKETKDQATLNWERTQRTLVSCGYFSCDQITINGKKVKAHYISDSTPQGNFNDVIFVDEQGHFVDGAQIKEVYGTDKKRPLLAFKQSDSANTNYFIGFSETSIPLDALVPTFAANSPQTFRHFTSPTYETSVRASTNQCSDDVINSTITKVIDNYKEHLALAKMATYLEEVDGILRGVLINPDFAPEGSCQDCGVFYSPEIAPIVDSFAPSENPPTISMKNAQQLFQQAKQMEDIAWDFLSDGCYARAHLMARRFESQGVYVDKIWVKSDIQVEREPYPIYWNFHVAPIVYVEDENNGVQKIVIDPSIANEPISVEQWLAEMNFLVKGDIVETPFPFPANVASFQRTAVAYSNSNPYLPDAPYDQSEAESIKQANETMKRYQQYSYQQYPSHERSE